MSDHEPIYVKFHTENEASEKDNDEPHENPSPKPNWKAASDDQKLDYNDSLFRKLTNMYVPDCVINCKDVHCQNENHKAEIDIYVNSLMSNISESGHETIPVKQHKPVNNSNSKSMPGWKVYVEPYQKKAQFWYAIWLSAGKPINTELHRIMKKTKNTFHYQIRRCRRVDEFIKNQ